MPTVTLESYDMNIGYSEASSFYAALLDVSIHSITFSFSEYLLSLFNVPNIVLDGTQ